MTRKILVNLRSALCQRQHPSRPHGRTHPNRRWVRFQKLRGHECHYCCADDTHGTPVMLAAQKQGIAPEDMIAKVREEHLADFTGFNIGYDNYYSTHSPENKQFSQDIYRSLKANGKIESRVIEQLFDPEKQMFLPDRFVKGECPKCHAQDQYGDNCEVCGTTYSPTELINPVFRRFRCQTRIARIRTLLLQTGRMRRLSQSMDFRQ